MKKCATSSWHSENRISHTIQRIFCARLWEHASNSDLALRWESPGKWYTGIRFRAAYDFNLLDRLIHTSHFSNIQKRKRNSIVTSNLTGSIDPGFENATIYRKDDDGGDQEPSGAYIVCSCSNEMTFLLRKFMLASRAATVCYTRGIARIQFLSFYGNAHHGNNMYNNYNIQIINFIL